MLHKPQLNFSDFGNYSCILKINHTQKTPPKYWLNSVDLPVVLILKQTDFLYFWGLFFKSLKGSQLDFKKQYLQSVTSACLCTGNKISYTSPMFCSLCREVDIIETGHIMSRSIVVLENGKTIWKAPIMKSKGFFNFP